MIGKLTFRLLPLWGAAFLIVGFQLQTSPVHAISCAANTTCTFDLMNSNISQLNGSIDVQVTWINGASSTEFDVQWLSGGPGTPKFISEFGYNASVATTTITGGGAVTDWNLTAPPCNTNCTVDGFGTFARDYQRNDGTYGVLAPIKFSLTSLVTSFGANSPNGADFVVHVGGYPSGCSGFVSDGTNNGPLPGGGGLTDNPSCGAQVPEPASLLLLGSGLAGLGLWQWKRPKAVKA